MKKRIQIIVILFLCLLVHSSYAQPSYCSVSPGPVCSGSFYISNVTLIDINRTSTCDGYINTGLQTDIVRGSTGNIIRVTLTNDGSANLNAQIRIFIDYNQDGDFCSFGELIHNDWDQLPTDIARVFSFDVPNTATLGLTRLRVMADSMGGSSGHLFDGCGGANNSCNGSSAFSGRGEVEDYTLNIVAPVDVREAAAQKISFSADPNPFKDVIKLHLAAVSSGAVRLELMDITGRLAYADVLRPVKGDNNISIPADSYPNGVYLCRIISGNEIETIKIIKIPN